MMIMLFCSINQYNVCWWRETIVADDDHDVDDYDDNGEDDDGDDVALFNPSIQCVLVLPVA